MIAPPPIDVIVRTIVDAVQPRRVVLFGSRARGNARRDSDLDLMVELDAVDDRKACDALIRDLFRDQHWEMDLKIYTPEQVDARRDDPGTLIYAIEREGKVVYRRPGLEVLPKAPMQVRERPRVPRSIKAWVGLAKVDLLDIENNVNAAETPWTAVAFHAQQAAEKYLKAFIIRHWQPPERTHNLTDLLRACRSLGDELSGLDADCKCLSQYAVKPRYPGDEDQPEPLPRLIDADEGRAAVSAMRRVVAAAAALLDQADTGGGP